MDSRLSPHNSAAHKGHLTPQEDNETVESLAEAFQEFHYHSTPRHSPSTATARSFQSTSSPSSSASSGFQDSSVSLRSLAEMQISSFYSQSPSQFGQSKLLEKIAKDKDKVEICIEEARKLNAQLTAEEDRLTYLQSKSKNKDLSHLTHRAAVTKNMLFTVTSYVSQKSTEIAKTFQWLGRRGGKRGTYLEEF